MKNNSSLIYNFCLVLGDGLAIIAAFVAAYILRVSLSHTMISAQVHARDYVIALISLLPFWLLIFALLGLYNSQNYDKRFSEFGRLLIGAFIGVLFVISYSYIANVVIFPARLVTAYGFGLVFFFALLFRTLARAIRRELFVFGVGINNVLIVGDTPTSHHLIKALAETRITGYRVLGVVGGVKHPFKPDSTHRTFSSFATAIEALNGQLHTIIQTELYAATEANDAVLTHAQENHIAYRFVPGNSGLFTGKIEVDLFQSVPVIAVHQTALIGWGRIVKRITDLILASLMLVTASPVMLLVALVIKITDSDGPVFFRQTRLTRFNNEFQVYKFRSFKMAYNGLAPEEAFKKLGKPELIKVYRNNGDYLDYDPRILGIGRFIRRMSLDELPQLFNVLRGDISLVGPRALVPEELAVYKQRHAILSVKSGLTGLAVISGRRDIPYDERRRLDLYYVQNWSFWNDLVILAKTISVVLFHQGAK